VTRHDFELTAAALDSPNANSYGANKFFFPSYTVQRWKVLGATLVCSSSISFNLSEDAESGREGKNTMEHRSTIAQKWKHADRVQRTNCSKKIIITVSCGSKGKDRPTIVVIKSIIWNSDGEYIDVDRDRCSSYSITWASDTNAGDTRLQILNSN
jgi:hypothetical protein